MVKLALNSEGPHPRRQGEKGRPRSGWRKKNFWPPRPGSSLWSTEAYNKQVKEELSAQQQ